MKGMVNGRAERVFFGMCCMALEGYGEKKLTCRWIIGIFRTFGNCCGEHGEWQDRGVEWSGPNLDLAKFRCCKPFPSLL